MASSSGRGPAHPARSVQSLKKAVQQRLLERLAATFPGLELVASGPITQRLGQTIEKNVWTPADPWEVDRRIQGLARKHAINLSHELAVALTRSLHQLKVNAKQSVDLTQKARERRLLRQSEDQRLLGNSGRAQVPTKAKLDDGDDGAIFQDPPITPENVADMVHLLLSLSRPADVTTATFAHLLLDPDRPRKSTYLDQEQRKALERAEWQKILLVEPLDGDEWRSTASDTSELSMWTESSDQPGSNPSGSENQDLVQYDADSAGLQHSEAAKSTSAGTISDPEWEAVRDERARALDEAGLHQLEQWRIVGGDLNALSDVVLVREAILAMQGYSGFLFMLQSPTTMDLRPHFINQTSPTGRARLEQLKSIADTSTTLLQLQAFVDEHSTGHTATAPSPGRSRSFEAFAEQVAIMLERARTYFSEYDCDLAVGFCAASKRLSRRSRDATLPALFAEIESEVASLLSIADLLADLGLFERRTVGECVEVECALLNGLQALLSFNLAEAATEQSLFRSDLSRCFLAMAQPWWRQVCSDVREGFSFSIPGLQDRDAVKKPEGIVICDRRINPLDSRFWQEGYRLRSFYNSKEGHDEAIPAFLMPFAAEILDGGKSVGLLRALGADVTSPLQPCEDLAAILQGCDKVAADLDLDGASSVDEDDDTLPSRLPSNRQITPAEAAAVVQRALFNTRTTAFTAQRHTNRQEDDAWQAGIALGTANPGFDLASRATNATSDGAFLADADLLRAAEESSQPEGLDLEEQLARSLLEPQLSQTLSNHLQPMLNVVRKRLHDALVSPWHEGGCDLHSHLAAIQGLFLMRQSVDLSDWCELVFREIDASGPGADMEPHFLNLSFRDAVGLSDRDANEVPGSWIDTTLVRFKVRRRMTNHTPAGVKRLSDIVATYQVPWPANYCFPAGALNAYQDVFVLLLQVQRARKAVATLLKTSHQHQLLSSLRTFWSLRRKVDWLVRIVGEYLVRDVIEASATQLRLSMDALITFDSLIECHGRAMDRMRFLCFLQPDQATLHESILDALDLAITVCNMYRSEFGDLDSKREQASVEDRKRRQDRRKGRRARRRVRLGEGLSDDEDDYDDQTGQQDRIDKEEASARAATFQGCPPQRGDQGGTDLDSLLSSSLDASRSWIDDVEASQNGFARKVAEREGEFQRLLDKIKAGVDEQVGKLAVDVALRSREMPSADEAIRQMHESRQRFQELLYALEEGR